jgi:hypothetical protein
MDSPVALPPRKSDYVARLPASLDELRGPSTGRMELPLHIAWSGRRVYDLDDARHCLLLYSLLLAEAPAADLRRLVNADLLCRLWPDLRRLLGPVQRRAWQALLPAAA